MARLAALKARGALKTPSGIPQYYKHQQNGVAVRFLRSYDVYIKQLREMSQIAYSGMTFRTSKLVSKFVIQTNLRDSQLLQV